MRRGIFSFILYLICTIGGGGIMIYAKLEADRINNGGGEPFEGIGVAVILILGIIIGAVGLAGLLFKGLHLGTGWGIFGFLCILIDLVVILALVSNMFSGEGSFAFNPVSAIICGLFGISAVSNFESLRR